MPFADNPREFTKANVESLNPNQMGCYGLYKSTGWVYVGKGDIRARLLSYLNGENACNRSGETYALGRCRYHRYGQRRKAFNRSSRSNLQ